MLETHAKLGWLRSGGMGDGGRAPVDLVIDAHAKAKRNTHHGDTENSKAIGDPESKYG